MYDPRSALALAFVFQSAPGPLAGGISYLTSGLWGWLTRFNPPPARWPGESAKPLERAPRRRGVSIRPRPLAGGIDVADIPCISP